MAILGIGIDLVEVGRIENLLERHGQRFQDRTFTAGEQAYCNPMSRPAVHFAARFAAKEAVAKALGTGFAEGVSWADVEVERDAAGKPSVRLHGGAARRAEALGITRWHLSLTHTQEQAMAQVIAEGI